MTLNGSRGALFVAIGAQHVAEAVRAAGQLHAIMPELPLALIADHDTKAECFEFVLRSECSDGLDAKVAGMPCSPFYDTLFFDVDTFVCSPVWELFDLLDRFDISAAHASNRRSRNQGRRSLAMPEPFPEYNTGVVLFRKSLQVLDFFEEWRRLFRADCDRYGDLDENRPTDQPSFREALYASRLHIATLAPEYNFRFRHGGFAGSPVRILHGRDENVANVASLVNGVYGRRVFLPQIGALQARPIGSKG